MKKIMLTIIILSFIGSCFGSYIIGYNLGVNRYYNDYFPEGNSHGVWSYTPYLESCPPYDYIQPFVSSYNLIEIIYGNVTNYNIYRLLQNGTKEFQTEQFIAGRLYNATFVFLTEELDKVDKLLNRTCFVPYNVFSDEYRIPNYALHRVYYEEINDNNWIIHKVCYEWECCDR